MSNLYQYNGKTWVEIKGNDYVLTEDDKRKIASSIEVPIVEKVIEKIEVIKEQPIVTEVTNNVENPFILDGQDIVDKVNELPTDDDEYKIDASHIKNLPKNKVENRTTTILRREPSSTSSNTVTVINNTASVISAYHAVYVNTANTTLPSVAYSQANALATSIVLGITTAAIPVGQQGTVITFGVLSGFDTSTFTTGDKLYLSTTDAGDLVNTPATSPDFNTFVGWALDSQINGSVFIKPEYPLAVEVYLGGLSSPSDSIAPSQKAVKTYVDTAAPVRYQYNGEALSGTKNGVNTIFTSRVPPILPIVTRNGQILVYGIDYTLVGNTFTLVVPPLSTTELYISYESYETPI